MIEHVLWLGVAFFAVGAYLFLFRRDLQRLIGVFLEFGGLTLLYLVMSYGFNVNTGEYTAIGYAAGILLVFLGVVYVLEWIYFVWQLFRQAI